MSYLALATVHSALLTGADRTAIIVAVNPVDNKVWKRSWAYAYEEQEDQPGAPMRAQMLTARFSPYCMRDGERIDGPRLMPLDDALHWCRQQAARVELWIGDLGAFSAGEAQGPAACSLERRAERASPPPAARL